MGNTLQITVVSSAIISSGTLLSNSFEPSFGGMNSLVLPPLQGFYTIDMNETGSHITASVPLQIGAITSGAPLMEHSKNFRWSLKEFSLTNPEEFTFGDLVFFSPGAGLNTYSSKLEKAQVVDPEKGAAKGLFIFDSYDLITEELHLIHKGFVDFPVGSEAIGTFHIGDTLYINIENKLSINPTTVSGSWIRSVGLCVPSNNPSIYRIWFDPDSTFVTLN